MVFNGLLFSALITEPPASRYLFNTHGTQKVNFEGDESEKSWFRWDFYHKKGLSPCYFFPKLLRPYSGWMQAPHLFQWGQNIFCVFCNTIQPHLHWPIKYMQAHIPGGRAVARKNQYISFICPNIFHVNRITLHYVLKSSSLLWTAGYYNYITIPFFLPPKQSKSMIFTLGNVKTSLEKIKILYVIYV